MKKILTIARFEFSEKVKTKAFLVFMIFFPLVTILVSILPGLLVSQPAESIKAVGMIDETRMFSTRFSEKLEAYRLPDGQPNYIILNFYRPGSPSRSMLREADSAVNRGIIDSYIHISNAGPDSFQVSLSMKPAGSFADAPRFEKIFNEINTSFRLARHGYDPQAINKLISPLHLQEKTVGGGTDKNFETMFFSSLIFLMLLFIMILFSGGLLIRSVVEEKSNRIMEILLSSCTAEQIMAGKIFGLGMLGLFQVSVWALIALALLGGNYIPHEVFNNFGLAIVYFALGYLFYTAIFVGVGSIVTTEQEAQHFTGYLSLILIMPLVLAIKVIQSPDIMLVKVLSYFPLTSPPIMLLRLNVQKPPAWEIALTIFILIASIYAAILVSARIFRIGILSYGKRPSFKELVEWIKEK